jgi:HAD superfamily hydrolase (TIGR01509 family)
MPPVDAVLFDLDDTLCAYQRSTGEVLSVAFERADVEPFFDVDAYYARFEDHLGDAETVDDLRERCFVDIAEQAGRDPDLALAVADAYAAERDQSSVDPLDGATEAVDALADDHHLGLVTNGPPGMQREKLAAVGLDGAFDVSVFAGFETPAKPDPAPFDRALDALDVPADRAIHVGNSLRTDVPGAQRAGLRAAWLRGADPDSRGDGADPEPQPEYVLEGMADLAARPWR